ncbi:hypothetical protein DL765_011590 [Monosporascus sp. GIB2]|nr:hypothetical protein DL765_011590 [Monosporascus sp. GIB2]
MALPPNVHLSQHPCLQAKLSRLRSKQTHAREAKILVHEIATILGCEALASALTAVDGPKVGYLFSESSRLAVGSTWSGPAPDPSNREEPQEVSLVPILRSGLGMVEAIQALLPEPVPVHHLGLYREPSTLEPVEYYNNLPNHNAPGGAAQSASKLAVILDPVIATGGTCAAAIQTLREWGARRVLVLSVIGASNGVARAAHEWPEGVDVWLAGLDPELTKTGMVRPGLGDIGDRLFLTVGK